MKYLTQSYVTDDSEEPGWQFYCPAGISQHYQMD